MAEHVWRFFRAGGLDQVLIETADDLRNLSTLDRKLWVALSCPTRGLEIDSRTLELIDEDGDGRIRPPELTGAVEWTCSMLKDPTGMLAGKGTLALDAIHPTAGAPVLLAAKRVLANLGQPEATEISVAQISDTVAIFATTPFNGDGVIPVEAAANEEQAELIKLVIASRGSTPDRSGYEGVGQSQVDSFYADLEAYAAWWSTGESDVLVVGDATPAAHTALLAVRAKVDDYFARCRILAFDGRAAEALNRSAEAYTALADQDLGPLGPDVAALPLQKIESGRALDLVNGLNPAWAAAVGALHTAVVLPVLGEGIHTLDEAAWSKLKAAFATYEAWLGSKAGTSVEGLGIAKIRELLADDGRAVLNELIAKDLALAPEVAAISDVEKLVRFHRDLGALLRNFVNFSAFYDYRESAIFQSGTLYLDQRACTLCVRVDDIAAHAAVAGMAKMYLAYCQLTRPSGVTLQVVAAFTQGDSDYLMVGRRGVFYDRKGVDWDAVITKVVENPISVRQAFWSPYKKVASLIESQVEKFASAQDAQVNEGAAAGVSGAADKVKGAEGPPSTFDIAKFAGIFGVISLAVGTIGVMLTAVIQGFLDLPLLVMPFAVLGLMLLISGPAMLMAALKLRQRTLGPLLEGNGWAVNGRVAVNIPLGTSYTAMKKLPPGVAWNLEDPFIDKAARRRKRWLTLLLIVVVGLVGWFWVKPNYLDPKLAPPAPAVAPAAEAAPAATATP